MAGTTRVLVCEDDTIVARDYAKQLESAGYAVVAQVYTGAQAVARTRELLPDVVLMDIQLPDMDGLSAVEAIAKEKPVAVVMVTGHTEPEFLARAREVGAFGYVVKPVVKGALPPAIETALARFRELQDLKESLASRKVIERAKGLLMQRAGLAEEQAYLALQKAARNRNEKLSELARRFLEAGDDWKALLAPKPKS